MIEATLLEFYIQVSIAVLLPIIPAFVLYKTLPAKTTVSGPFQGLNIQLTGAFGGYFLVLLVVVGLIYAQRKPPRYEVWTVTGKVTIADSSSGEPQQINHNDFSIQPPTTLLYPDGRFDLDVLVRPDQNGNLNFPIIVINHPGFAPLTIPLSDQQPTFGGKSLQFRSDDKAKKRIIETPIVLEALPPRRQP